MFVNKNNFVLHPVMRHPMTGGWPGPGEGILNLLEGTITLTKPEDYTELPDDWFLPLTKKDRPPKGKEKIYRYMLSEKGWEAVKDQMRDGYCYPKCSFDEFADCLTHNIKHYRKTQERRAKAIA